MSGGDPGTQAVCERALAREIVRSERLRLVIVTVVLELGFARWLLGWLLLVCRRDAPTVAASSLGPLTILGGVALGYELYSSSSPAERSGTTDRFP